MDVKHHLTNLCVITAVARCYWWWHFALHQLLYIGPS